MEGGGGGREAENDRRQELLPPHQIEANSSTHRQSIDTASDAVEKETKLKSPQRCQMHQRYLKVSKELPLISHAVTVSFSPSFSLGNSPQLNFHRIIRLAGAGLCGVAIV